MLYDETSRTSHAHQSWISSHPYRCMVGDPIFKHDLILSTGGGPFKLTQLV